MRIFKKIILFTFLAIIFLFTNSTFAGDIPESIMTGDQKALFIGVLSEIKDNTCVLIPKTIMMGDIVADPITVDCFDKYYGTSKKPQEEDIVVAVLNQDNTLSSWIFKTTSEDYRILKLESERYNMVERYEKYINEGKYFKASEEKVKTEGLSEVKPVDLEVQESSKSINIYLGIIIIILLGIIFYFFKKNQ